jgi:L-ascorbate metabolism protein UlaG (beta-lactamase superfamily)
MVITYAGGYCFKISSGDTMIAVNPPESTSAHKVAKFGADVVLISTQHPDWNGEGTAMLGGKEPFVVRGPGAYEIGDVVVTGYASEGALVGETSEYANTVYVVRFDGIKILILGALSNNKISQDALGDAGDVDIVFVPVGGATLEPKKAHELVVKLEAKVIIPYAVGNERELSEFLENEGAKGVKPVDKLTLRAKEVAGMSGEIVILK